VIQRHTHAIFIPVPGLGPDVMSDAIVKEQRR
jgi:hypothetical protein